MARALRRVACRRRLRTDLSHCRGGQGARHVRRRRATGGRDEHHQRIASAAAQVVSEHPAPPGARAKQLRKSVHQHPYLRDLSRRVNEEDRIARFHEFSRRACRRHTAAGRREHRPRGRRDLDASAATSCPTDSAYRVRSSVLAEQGHLPLTTRCRWSIRQPSLILRPPLGVEVAPGRPRPGATTRARMPSVARRLTSEITGKMLAATSR